MISTQQQQQQTQEDEDEEQTNSSGFCAFCLELVGGTSKKQNWKALGIAFLVITIICLFITVAILLTTNQHIPIDNPPSPIDENDIAQIPFPSPWNGTWLSEHSFTYLSKNNSIWIYHCDTLENEILFDRQILPEESIDHAIVSPSTKFILIPIEKEKIRSYYTEYRYHIYEKRTNDQSFILRTEPKFPFTALVYSHSDYFFAFVYNYNVYLYDLKENIDSQITFDGNRDLIHNGLIEWIYEYEIFQKSHLLYWSIDDRYLAYVKINLTNLSKNTFLKYDFNDDNDERYAIPYPKFNQSIPQISAHIYDTKTRKILRIPRPYEYEKSRKSYVYIYHFVWYSPRSFAIVYGNRRENSSVIQLYEIVNERILVKSRFIEETRRGLIISRYLKPVFSPGGNSINIIRFEQINKQKAFPRVVRILLNEGLMQIDGKASNEILADEILHVDRLGRVYFTGSRRNDSLERQIFRWDLSTTECLSCNQPCAYANAKFSLGDGKYYILQCLGPDIPYAKLFNQSDELALINDNQPFREWIEGRLIPYIDYFTVPLTNKNTGNGMIIFPPNYTPNRTIASYPVIISINDRLDDQRVTRKYYFSIPEFLQVIEGNLALVIFDAHGSAGQDENFAKNNYQDWFDRQVEDYLKLARYLKWNETRFSPTLNHTQFGLQARGPAAMIALYLLENSEEYACAYLQSPVTDLNYYHAIFSERVYDLKSDFKSLKDRKETLRNKSLTIVHGTADEVVHFKHSARLVQSLLTANISFDFKVYPDSGHYFEQDPKIYKNFLHSERQFFRRCLGSRTNKDRKSILSEEDYE